MTRPQKFEREQLIDRATEVFWEQGYEATKIPDLTQRMGILSGSLYYLFGDKNALFVACLTQYSEQVQAKTKDMLNVSGSKREAIARFFEVIVENLASDPARRGCLLTNTLVESAGRNAVALRIMEESRIATERALIKALEGAERNGEIRLRTSEERRMLAQSLVSALQGIRVTAKTVTEPDTLQEIARTTLALLD